MLTIRSYLLNPNMKIRDLRDVQNNSSKYFIDISNENKIRSIANLVDPNYINGALYVSYDNLVLIDFVHWDILDQLWSYMLGLVLELQEVEKSSFFFPDQPLELTVQILSNHEVLITFNDGITVKKIKVDKNIFYHSIVEGAELFFNIVQKYITQSNSESVLREKNRIELLRRLIFN